MHYKKEKLYYLDGIKEIACMGVFLYHYYATFCQQVSSIQFDSTSMEYVLGCILKPVIDGPLLVRIFALISGFLVAGTQILTAHELLNKCLKRYLRFVLPMVVPSVVIIFIFQKLGMFYSEEAATLLGIKSLNGLFTHKNITITGGIQQIAYKMLFLGDGTWNPPFWMLSSIFEGSILVYICNFLKNKINKNLLQAIGIIGIIVILYLMNQTTACMVIIGAVIRWKKDELDKVNIIIWKIIFIFALIMVYGGHHSIYVLASKILKLSSILDYSLQIKMIYAVMLFISILYLNKMQSVLNNAILCWLGRISLAVFTIHWSVMCSVGAFIICKLNINYIARFWIALVVTTVVLLTLAELYYKTIVKISESIIIKVQTIFLQA